MPQIDFAFIAIYAFLRMNQVEGSHRKYLYRMYGTGTVPYEASDGMCLYALLSCPWIPVSFDVHA